MAYCFYLCSLKRSLPAVVEIRLGLATCLHSRPCHAHAHTSKLTEMSAAVPTTIFTHCCCFLCAYNSCSFIFNCHWPTRFAVRTRIGIKCCQTETERKRGTDGQTVCATDNYNCVIFFSLATFYSRFVFVCRYSLLVSRFPFSISHHMCHRES